MSQIMATWKGLEPSTSSVTGWHSNQLNYQAAFLFKWWDQQGSNLWPPACKAGALPAELWSHFGAGEGDRTLTAGLEGQNSTIELHPQDIGDS